MALNIDCCDAKKYQLKWSKVLDCMRGLEFKSHVCQLCVILIVCYFNNIIECGNDNIILYL